MGIEKFGTVSFTAEAKAGDFVKYLEEGKTMATRCRKCQRAYFPPRVDCADCLASDMEWFELSDKGKLITYSVVQYGPTGFENDAPYTIALAEFPGGVRVFGRLPKEAKEGEFKPGMEVRLKSVKLPEGRFAYQFEAAKS